MGYYIEVPQNASSKMSAEFILRQSLITGLRYITPELSELQHRLTHAKEDAILLEIKLFNEIIEELRDILPMLKETILALSKLDVFCALAYLAYTQDYTRPMIDASCHFSIIGGRHPVIEQMMQHQAAKQFIKNDCMILNEKRLWLLTGPNMAGKSTFLRQNALIAFMSHIGSFVPATKAHIGTIDRIFSRVGASDDISRGHSTFMMEMIETATILNQATEKSFVILDEIGRGTATYDGLALAWSCVEHLSQELKCRTLFATHYHELTELQGSAELECYTLNIKEWDNKIIFLYEVISGIANRSYGIHVARLAGIPEKILLRAEEILHRFENLIEK